MLSVRAWFSESQNYQRRLALNALGVIREVLHVENLVGRRCPVIFARVEHGRAGALPALRRKKACAEMSIRAEAVSSPASRSI
jgi:hypothetical protein